MANLYRKKRRILAAVLAGAFSCGAVSGCGGTGRGASTSTDTGSVSTGSEKTEIGKEGWYTLTNKTVAGKDITDSFLYNCIRLEGGVATAYEIDYSGRTETEGTYSVEGSSVNILFGVKSYKYEYEENTDRMTYSGKVNKQTVVMSYAYDAEFTLQTAQTGVSFFEELFGESKDENFYNYCPSVMMEGNDVMHVWYCSNKDSGQVTDYVAYRKGALNAEGRWEFGEKQLVLSPTAGSWDDVHTCDPSVVKGNFTMKGEKYSYLMAYLGCKTYDCTCNEVGIALAKNPEGPYIKADELNPIADFYTSADYDKSSWGYGQPCVISSDNAGKILLFYTKGVKSGTYVYVEEWDLSDISKAKLVREGRLYDKGVVNASGQTDCINNADFAYDPFLKRLYCLKEDFPYPADGGVDWISGSNTLLYVELGDTGFDALFTTHTWNVCDTVTAQKTGHFRNHNMGIVTDAYGAVVNPFEIPIVYTVSDAADDYPDWTAKGQWPALHTYRLYGYVFEVR